jgi:hypothetical protein
MGGIRLPYTRDHVDDVLIVDPAFMHRLTTDKEFLLQQFGKQRPFSGTEDMSAIILKAGGRQVKNAYTTPCKRAS